MITFSIVKEIFLEKASRFLKVQELGVKTADQVSSFGDDSSPIKGMTAIYGKTSENSDNIIIGYINKNQISNPGEKRIFSLDSKESVSFYIHLRNNGVCEIGGDDDNAVRFSELEAGFNNLREDLNQLIQSYNNHQHTLPNGASPPNIIVNNSSANINNAKIENILVPRGEVFE